MRYYKNADAPIEIIKRGAWTKVCRAIESGKLARPASCQKCGVPCKPDAHHEDHSKPLDVEWLCEKCHTDANRLLCRPDKDVANAIIESFSRKHRDKAKSRLTGRELQIVKLLALGMRNEEVSKELKISVRTVETHRERAYRFCKSTNVAQMIGWLLHERKITVGMLTARFDKSP